MGAIRRDTQVTAAPFSRKMNIMTQGQPVNRNGMVHLKPHLHSLSGGCSPSRTNFLKLWPAELGRPEV